MTFDPATVRNMYYHDPEKFDLQKMRDEAYKRAQGDKFNKPEVVVLHHHAKESRCGLLHVDVPEQKHEEFQPPQRCEVEQG